MFLLDHEDYVSQNRLLRRLAETFWGFVHVRYPFVPDKNPKSVTKEVDFIEDSVLEARCVCRKQDGKLSSDDFTPADCFFLILDCNFCTACASQALLPLLKHWWCFFWLYIACYLHTKCHLPLRRENKHITCLPVAKWCVRSVNSLPDSQSKCTI